jgi:hypothetical protein
MVAIRRNVGFARPRAVRRNEVRATAVGFRHAPGVASKLLRARRHEPSLAAPPHLLYFS